MTPDDAGVSSNWGFCLAFSHEYLLLGQMQVQWLCVCLSGVPAVTCIPASAGGELPAGLVGSGM